jgi:hypothetical protein
LELVELDRLREVVIEPGRDRLSLVFFAPVTGKRHQNGSPELRVALSDSKALHAKGSIRDLPLSDRHQSVSERASKVRYSDKIDS